MLTSMNFWTSLRFAVAGISAALVTWGTITPEDAQGLDAAMAQLAGSVGFIGTLGAGIYKNFKVKNAVEGAAAAPSTAPVTVTAEKAAKEAGL